MYEILNFLYTSKPKSLTTDILNFYKKVNYLNICQTLSWSTSYKW